MHLIFSVFSNGFLDKTEMKYRGVFIFMKTCLEPIIPRMKAQMRRKTSKEKA